MVKVFYIGPSRTGVDVAMPDGSGAHVEHGAALETTEEHATSLTEQAENWSTSAPSKAKATPSSSPPAASKADGEEGA
jgi:hypothetical protein